MFKFHTHTQSETVNVDGLLPTEYHTTINPLYTNNHAHGVQNQLLEQIYLDYHI